MYKSHTEKLAVLNADSVTRPKIDSSSHVIAAESTAVNLYRYAVGIPYLGIGVFGNLIADNGTTYTASNGRKIFTCSTAYLVSNHSPSNSADDGACNSIVTACILSADNFYICHTAIFDGTNGGT